MKMKKCNTCNCVKSIEEFRFNKNKNLFYSQCKQCERERQKIYYKKNKEYYSEYRKKHKDQQRKYNYEHREEIKEYNYSYYNKYKKELGEKHNNYNKQNRKKINEYNRIRKKDGLVYFKDRIRKNILKAFKRKNKVKNKKNEEILGITVENFYNYLLQTFKSNYGYEWDGVEPVHIDHIIPLSTAKTEEDVIKLCHYTNLQLLKAKDNLKKSCRTNWNLEV